MSSPIGKLIPFTARFEPSPENNQFVQQLESDHLDEVFSWIAEGSRQFYEGGVGDIPKCCTVSMQDYISANDNVARFMSLVLEAAEGKMKRVVVWNAYESYCEHQKEAPVF